jgi:hypothetical protein
LAAVIIVFLLVALFFGLAFAVKWLFIAAAIMALVWLVGFFARAPEVRWYRW